MTGSSVITVYDTSTGAIAKVTSIPAGTEDAQCETGQAWLAGRPPSGDWRIDLGTMGYAPLLEFDLTIETNRVSGIPAGTVMTVHGEPYEEAPEDGIVEIVVAYPQTISIQLIHPLYQYLPMIEVPCAPEG